MKARPTTPIGTRVGHFVVVGHRILPLEERWKDKDVRHLYVVRDMRCGHEREIRTKNPNLLKGFSGSQARCGCPVRTKQREYIIWQWANPAGGRNQIAIQEHRLVMEGIVGRELRPDETVHHINGNTTDNRPENLQLRQGKHGRGVVMHCGDCGSYNIRPREIAA